MKRIRNYCTYRNDKNNRKGGGMALSRKKCIPHTKLNITLKMLIEAVGYLYTPLPTEKHCKLQYISPLIGFNLNIT
jgi:hypothetical protein